MNDTDEIKFEQIRCTEPEQLVDWLQMFLDTDRYIYVTSLRILEVRGGWFAFVAVAKTNFEEPEPEALTTMSDPALEKFKEFLNSRSDSDRPHRAKTEVYRSI